MTIEIKEWMKEAAKEIRYTTSGHPTIRSEPELAQIIAAHAPSEGEPPAAPDKCPTCGSAERSVRFCAAWKDFADAALVYPHSVRSGAACKNCADPWHESNPAAPRMEEAESAQLDEMVRDFTQVGPRPKSEVRRRILEYAEAYAARGKAPATPTVKDLPPPKWHIEGTGEPVEAEAPEPVGEATDRLPQESKETLSYRTEANILAALMESLIKQNCPDSVSGYDIMDAIRPFLPRENSSTVEALRQLYKVCDRIARCGSVEEFTVASIRAELRDALHAIDTPGVPEQKDVEKGGAN